MTIGVIDECRKLGIGTYLLKSTINAVMMSDKWVASCKFIYLHVASYNKVALRFYEKNGFVKSKEMKDWYDIFDKQYDAFELYKLIDF
jgi:ribosomal protein S18 acetylase RimI-like enzyme